MSRVVEWHVNNAIAWRNEQNYSLTKERCESMNVLIDEYLKLKAENDALRAVLTKAASIGLAHGIGLPAAALVATDEKP
jgi:hypothetical protein